MRVTSKDIIRVARAILDRLLFFLDLKTSTRANMKKGRPRKNKNIPNPPASMKIVKR